MPKYGFEIANVSLKINFVINESKFVKKNGSTAKPKTNGFEIKPKKKNRESAPSK